MKNILELYFNKKMSQKKINNYINKLEDKCHKRTAVNLENRENIKVSCVQRQIRIVKSIEEYAGMIKGFVEQAAHEISDIIVFPEYNFFDLFGLVPGFTVINGYLNKKARDNKTASENENGKDKTLLRFLFESISEPSRKAIDDIMCGLAKKYGIYIYTGSYLISEGGNLYNGGSLISREGKILGMQKKIHLTDFEEDIGIKQDSTLGVFSLDIGKAACPVCMDATYYETFRMAVQSGAEIAILPIANMEEYNEWKALRGIWPRVQESYIYGLKASLNGWIGGMHFTGKAGIFAPINLTEKKDGIVAIAPHYEGDYLVSAEINVKRLYEGRENAEYYGDVNYDFEREYYKKTYRRY